MTLLREIQLLLERTYAPVPINLEHCLIGDGRCAALTRLAGPSAVGLAPQGRTFLRQENGVLRLAIFYAAPVIAELEANDPRRALNERNIAPLITFIEEIAHGVQAALLFWKANAPSTPRPTRATSKRRPRSTPISFSASLRSCSAAARFHVELERGCAVNFLTPVINVSVLSRLGPVIAKPSVAQRPFFVVFVLFPLVNAHRFCASFAP